jgi:endonuclease/exonuclease/phosphatase family metal-dependent hydrolase
MKNIQLLLILFVGMTAHLMADAQVFHHLYENQENHPYFRVMSYNTKLLFDCEDDPNVQLDQKFCPKDYPAKLEALAATIKRNQPDILGLQEVENVQVLKDLNAEFDSPFGIVHYESADTMTGQDVALFYNKNKFEETGYFHNNLEYRRPLTDLDGNEIYKSTRLSKGILEIELKSKESGERFVFMVVHLKGQIGGYMSDIKRMAQANTLRYQIEDTLWEGKQHIVLMGDFNDINPSPTIEFITGESKFHYDFDGSKVNVMYDLLVDYPRDLNYTYYIKKRLWAGNSKRYIGTFYQRLDYIFASPKMKGRATRRYIDHTDNIQKRWPSDHAPVIVDFKLYK